MNRKLGRMKQWAGEKMGQESKTTVSDEFKELEMEMDLRHRGMEDLHRSMTTYIKSLARRNEEAKNKQLVPNYFGATMARHGEDFEADSNYGNCLIALGRSNERLGRFQESYVTDSTNIWLESLERSLAMMKEYQAARKKLEQRRLAYDASLSKMQRVKKEDFRAEEELRSQKAKYEESNEDVFRRMQDVKEAEGDTVRDLGAFLDAELAYYDKCTSELRRLKENWPGPASDESYERPTSRSRASTAHAYNERFSSGPKTAEHSPISETELESESFRPSIRSRDRVTGGTDSPQRKPSTGRALTFQGPSSTKETPTDFVRQASMPPAIERARTTLRPTPRRNDTFGDPSDDSDGTSPDRSSLPDRSVSPATSYGSVASRTMSQAGSVNGAKRGPPPPPNRATKPPPPLPAKKANLMDRR